MIDFNNKKIAVTGANGMIGKELVRILKEEYSPKSVLEADLPIYDLRDRTDAAYVCDGQDIVFHLAAQPLVRESYIKTIDTYQTNVIGTLNVLDVVLTVNNILVNSRSADASSFQINKSYKKQSG